MKIKSKIVKKLRNDNMLSLELCMKLDIQQGALFRRIERNIESLQDNLTVYEFFKSKGMKDDEILESEKLTYKSLSNN